ncbi:MAG: HAD hydrolase family protein, partial [Muribaculaceae bacterium]|nr:HAD hydrolase family protein [Muribaculaceae bacterium]
LNSESVISPATADSLNRLIEQRDALFTVATARTPATAVPLLEKVRLQLPMIVMTGAATWNPTTAAYENVHAIPNSTVRRIVEAFTAHGLSPFVYRRRGNKLQAHHAGMLSEPEKEFVAQRQGLKLKKFFFDETPLQACGRGEAMLIFSMNDYSRLEPVYDILKQMTDCSPNFYRDIFTPEVGLLDIYAEQCSKAAAITALAQRINAQRIVVFGDNLNDIAMMQAATHAVAVDNAVPQVKEIAHEIIGDNDHNSVATWIEQDLNK